ncbi:hypothetical protein Tco_0168371 [Tanacetum coccineum]
MNKSILVSYSSSIVNIKSIILMKVKCACVFIDRWRLDELAYGIPLDGPYQTNLPSIEDIILSIRIDREGQVCQIRHEEEIDVLEYQIPTHEILSTLKPLEEIIRENVFCLGNEFPAIIYNDALTSKSEISSNFENEFPAIVYNDALATDHKISFEPAETFEDDVGGAGILCTIFEESPYPFNYPTRRLTMEEMLAKFIDEGKCEHEEMDIFIKEFRTTNELLLKTRCNLLSELKIEVNELSKVVSNILIPKNKVKGVTTRGGKMTSEATRSKEINETGINKNEPPRFEQDVQEKPHDGVQNKSSSIPEKTNQSLVKPQQSSIPFPNRVRKEKEEALQRIFFGESETTRY